MRRCPTSMRADDRGNEDGQAGTGTATDASPDAGPSDADGGDPAVTPARAPASTIPTTNTGTSGLGDGLERLRVRDHYSDGKKTDPARRGHGRRRTLDGVEVGRRPSSNPTLCTCDDLDPTTTTRPTNADDRR